MCIIFVTELAEAKFLGPKVSGTNLFVAPSGDGQVTLYENRVGLDGYEGEPHGAMILPVPSGHPVELLDLTDYGECFTTLNDGFDATLPTKAHTMANPYEHKRWSGGMGCYLDGMQARCAEMMEASRFLEVQDIGSYFCSIAEAPADLDRIDPGVFSVPEGITALLAKHYGEGFSFVVCRFKNKEVKPHPIGYKSARHADGSLFVPTRHSHSGKEETAEEADWDHHISKP